MSVTTAIVARPAPLVAEPQHVDPRALHSAVESGSVENVHNVLSKDQGRLLLLAVDSNGQTALHVAAYLGHLDVVKFLASHEPRLISAKDTSLNRTALHIAAIMGEPEVVAWLARKGGKPLIQAVDSNGKTALDIGTDECKEILQQQFE